MKNLTLLILLSLISVLTLSAQTVNDFKLEDIPARYVQLVSTSGLINIFKVTTYVDYGQIGRMKDINKGHIIGDDGKTIKFNGVMGVLNFFETKGYRYISQNVVSGQGGNVYHYLLENLNYKNSEKDEIYIQQEDKNERIQKRIKQLDTLLKNGEITNNQYNQAIKDLDNLKQ